MPLDPARMYHQPRTTGNTPMRPIIDEPAKPTAAQTAEAAEYLAEARKLIEDVASRRAARER